MKVCCARFAILAVVVCGVFVGADPAIAVQWDAGLAKVEITPTEPVRMSGYGSRDHSSEGIDTPLYARAICIRERDDKMNRTTAVLVTVDNIGLSGEISRRLAKAIKNQHGIGRERIVFSSTHTHSGPDLNAQLSNIFATPLSPDERDAASRYAKQMEQGILKSVSDAINDLSPAQLHHGVGKATFAANRRVLTAGRWAGFGVQQDGPVDHTVPLIRVVAPSGQLRGVVFNYACHCTTVGGDYYKINADWAGYATTTIESNHDGVVALCTIGCGADANPNPRGTVALSKMHGHELAQEVERLLQTQLTPISESLSCQFDYAALSFELPTKEELKDRLEHESGTQARRHAEEMLRIYQEKGRLPATYPVPIQSWRFGNQLGMVFIGGEVVIDYAIRLKKVLNDSRLWVTAYANDVMGYVASERMRDEGGYEFDRSGIYYGLPGPWESGTESKLIERIAEVFSETGRAGPTASEESISKMDVADGFEIELVAAEPLVQDPINLAFGDDGRLWVVEMADYPTDISGGRIKVLSDNDGDGQMDSSVVFLSGIGFPTGVQPWKDGVLISAAPEILFARDTDGDSKADEVTPVYSGFRLANPQHRVSGFTYGLDHSLHLAAGDNLGTVKSLVTNQAVNASGCDVVIWPDSGKIAVTNGRTQFIRTRDDFGRWFGNSNSEPMFHFPIPLRYLKRNNLANYSVGQQQLFSPPVAPPVFPKTEAKERFNDLFAANRFTSACSSEIARVPGFRVSDGETAFVCEPVHNLVHRAFLKPSGASFRAERFDSESEFLASSDPWFRPVRSTFGPDGCLYVVDMYRETIEHPEWIPEVWQRQLDLRAGEDRGRIYRVGPVGTSTHDSVNLLDQSDSQLVDNLKSPVGPLRDQSQRILLTRSSSDLHTLIRGCLQDSQNPFLITHSLSMLSVLKQLTPNDLGPAFRAGESGPLLVALRLSEPFLDQDSNLLQKVQQLAEHPDPSVALQTALTIGESRSADVSETLYRISVRSDLDRWLVNAIISSAKSCSNDLLKRFTDLLVQNGDPLDDSKRQLFEQLIRICVGETEEIPRELIVAIGSSEIPAATRMEIAALIIKSVEATEKKVSSLAEMVSPIQQYAHECLADSNQSESNRCRAVGLIGLDIDSDDGETKEMLLELLNPAVPVSVQNEIITVILDRQNLADVDSLFESWESYSNLIRGHLVSGSLKRRSSAEVLLSQIEQGKVLVTDLSLSARNQLLNTGSRSMRVRAARLVAKPGGGDREKIVQKYHDQIRSIHATGDDSQRLPAGRMLFAKHCGVCHTPDDSGRTIGASLANLSDRSELGLLESILNPNRAVDPKYRSYMIQTTDGKTYAGMIQREVAGSLTLAHADGKRTMIHRSQIERMKDSGLSMMPEGFETTLAPDEMLSVIRYLQSDRASP